MTRPWIGALAALALTACATPGPAPDATGFDAALAQSVGADEHGMRSYVFVLLKSGPTPMPAGPERSAMFKAHLANIERLARAGTLAVAGPFDGVDGWRGMFILAVKDIEEARRHVETDPVIASGEMVAEYHKLYGTAALMTTWPTHQRIAAKNF